MSPCVLLLIFRRPLLTFTHAVHFYVSGMDESPNVAFISYTLIIIWKYIDQCENLYGVIGARANYILIHSHTAIASHLHIESHIRATTRTAENFISFLRHELPRKRIAYFCTFCWAPSVPYRIGHMVCWERTRPFVATKYSLLALISLLRFSSFHSIECVDTTNLCHFSVSNTFISLLFTIFHFLHFDEANPSSVSNKAKPNQI